MIGHVAFQPEPAKPPVGQVQMHLFTQPAFRADTEAMADQQHAYQQLGIDRRMANLVVEGPQVSTDAGQVDEPSDRAQQMIGWTVPFE